MSSDAENKRIITFIVIIVILFSFLTGTGASEGGEGNSDVIIV